MENGYTADRTVGPATITDAGSDFDPDTSDRRGIDAGNPGGDSRDDGGSAGLITRFGAGRHTRRSPHAKRGAERPATTGTDADTDTGENKYRRFTRFDDTRESGHLASEGDSVVIEDTPAPHRQKRKYTRRQSKGVITAQNVEEWTVSGFQLVSMIRQRPWWQVTPEETKPWSQHAANALNPALDKIAEKLGLQAATNVSVVVSAGIAAMGLLSLVMVRMQFDAFAEAQQRQQIHEQTAKKADQFVRENASRTTETTPPRASGNGAQPVGPTFTIDGINGMGEGGPV